MTMDTDSNPDEESRDGQDRPSPSHTHGDAAVRAVSAPCSPSGTGPGPSCSSGSALDCASSQKAGGRPNSLPPSSPRALPHNDWAYDSAVSPVERQHPGMQRDKGIHAARRRVNVRTLYCRALRYCFMCRLMLSFAVDLKWRWELLTR